jgi:Domain of Unknown Function with PDB structure (DUF3857)/Transglutaminase-like superfamily
LRVARATDWPPLDPNDLKITSLAQQPGAPAFILLREELTDDPMNYHQVYKRMKILTDAGKRYADVEIPYGRRTFRIEDVSGRTIHADGTIIPFDGKVFDKQVVKKRGDAGERVNVKSFTLPDVQVGSIIEYRYSIRYDDRVFYAPYWEVQSDLFQRQASFKFIPYAGDLIMSHDRVGRGYAWTGVLPTGAHIQEHQLPQNHLASPRQSNEYVDLVLTDIPALIEEPYMPPLDAVRYRVEFYYRLPGKQEEYWKGEGKYWSKDTDSFLDKKGGLQDAVAKATASAATPEDKIKNIYYLVSRLDNWSYDPPREAQEAKALGRKINRGADDALRQHGGTHDDLNRLMVAMARIAGISASVMWVPSRDRNFFEPNLLSTHQLEAEIAIVELDGKDVFLDPGTKFCPYGMIDWRYSQVRGIRQSAGGKGTEIATTSLPDYKTSQLQRLAKLQLQDDGHAEGTVKVGFYGQHAVDLRQLGGKTDAEGKKKLLEDELKAWLPGNADVTLDGTPNWEDFDHHLMAGFKVSMPLAVSSGKRWLVPVHVFQVNSTPRFGASTRNNPVYFDYLFMELDEVHVTLPAGMGVESIPTDDMVRTDFSVYSTSQKAEGTTSIVSRRNLLMGGLMFPPANYGELKSFFDKVKTGDDQPLLVKGTAHAEVR